MMVRKRVDPMLIAVSVTPPRRCMTDPSRHVVLHPREVAVLHRVVHHAFALEVDGQVVVVVAVHGRLLAGLEGVVPHPHVLVLEQELTDGRQRFVGHASILPRILTSDRIHSDRTTIGTSTRNTATTPRATLGCWIGMSVPGYEHTCWTPSQVPGS
jgi:hypothetical protein